MTNIIDIEGIGEVYATKLTTAGYNTIETLLKKGCTAAGRKAIAAETDISEKLILEWCNLADLMRIKGIGEEFSDLLEEAGVDTVKELRHRNAANLHTKIREVNEAKSLTRRLPSVDQLEDFIAQAKELKAMMEY